jgi:hypothetical protein
MSENNEAADSFSLELWLEAQDVSSRDESLDEQCARMYILHQSLTSPDTVTALARDIVEMDESALDLIAETADSEEPRFAVMVFVDILAALQKCANPDSGPNCILSVAMGRIARAMPSVVDALCEQASMNDICGDALSYTLTILSFLLGDSGCQDSEALAYLQTLATPTWLKLVMRTWKDSALVGHVPGEEAPNFGRGLGYLVTLYVESVSKFPIDGYIEMNDGDESGDGVRTLVGLGQWLVAFVCMRVYSAHITEDERARLTGILWRCVQSNPEFGSKHVFSDPRVVQALCDSAVKITSQMSCPDLRVRTLGDIELRVLSTSGYGLFSVARLLQAGLSGSLKDADTMLRSAVPHRWFFDAIFHFVEVCKMLMTFDPVLCANIRFLRIPCSLSCTASILWVTCEWLAVSNFQRTELVPDSLARSEVLARLRTLATTLCGISESPIQAQCAKNLADRLISTSPLTTRPSDVSLGQVCEWCFDVDAPGQGRMRACGRCEQVYFCDQEHLRHQWKKSHKRECSFLRGGDSRSCAAAVGSADLRRGPGGDLYDVARCERVGDICARDGVEVVLRRYGAYVRSLGGTLKIVYQSSATVAVTYVSAGQFIRAQLETRGKSDEGQRAIIWAYLATMRSCDDHSVLAELTGPSLLRQYHDENRKSIVLFRTKYKRVPESGAECAVHGCRSHDEFCAS